MIKFRKRLVLSSTGLKNNGLSGRKTKKIGPGSNGKTGRMTSRPNGMKRNGLSGKRNSKTTGKESGERAAVNGLKTRSNSSTKNLKTNLMSRSD